MQCSAHDCPRYLYPSKNKHGIDDRIINENISGYVTPYSILNFIQLLLNHDICSIITESHSKACRVLLLKMRNLRYIAQTIIRNPRSMTSLVIWGFPKRDRSWKYYTCGPLCLIITHINMVFTPGTISSRWVYSTHAQMIFAGANDYR